MRLTPAEQDRLTIFTLAELARRRLSRGRRLSAPEVVALITDTVLEAAWDGGSMEEVTEAGHAAVAPEQAQAGAAALVSHIEIDALFPTGTALVAIDDPVGTPSEGDPGAVLTGSGEHLLNTHRSGIEVEVTNTADVAVRISSHYPFWEVNSTLVFDRSAARGMRLDVPAGSTVGFKPGESRTVRLVRLGGNAKAPRLLLEPCSGQGQS